MRNRSEWFAVIAVAAALLAHAGPVYAKGPHGGSFHAGPSRAAPSPGPSFRGGPSRAAPSRVVSPRRGPAHVPSHVARPAPPARMAHPGPHHPPTPFYHPRGHFRYLLAPPVGYLSIAFGGITYYRYGYLYYRPYWYDNRWIYVEVAPPVGLVVAELPPSPVRVVINGQVYYRYGTTFYAEKPAAAPTGPTAAGPPVTVPTATSPPAATTTVANAPNTDGTNAAPMPPDKVTVEAKATTGPAATGQAPASGADGPEIVPPGYVVTKPPIGALVEMLPPDAKTVSAGSTTYFHADDVYYLPITVAGKTHYVVVQKPN